MRAILLDQIRALSEPRAILAVVAGGLGYVIAQRKEHLVAHKLFIVDFRIFGNRLLDQRIRVLAVPQELGIERLMIDARAGVLDFVFRRADPLGQHARGALHAVAQTAGDELREPALNRAAQHRHGVGVVQINRVRAIAPDVGGNVQNGVHGAQIAENTAGAARVAHVGIHAVLLGN